LLSPGAVMWVQKIDFGAIYESGFQNP